MAYIYTSIMWFATWQKSKIQDSKIWLSLYSYNANVKQFQDGVNAAVLFLHSCKLGRRAGSSFLTQTTGVMNSKQQHLSVRWQGNI